MTRRSTHNYWFWLAAAFAIGGTSLQWGPTWTGVERHGAATSEGRPLDVVRHPGVPETASQRSVGTTGRTIVRPVPADAEIEATFRERPEAFVQLPRRSQAEGLATPLEEDVRVAEFRDLSEGRNLRQVLPVEDQHPLIAPRSPAAQSQRGSGPVRLTGKIVPVED
ncbi:MAG: hypothetical protein KDA58_11135 [Planctomycetaceae bacterium]|nr:hypothetical protein [Planctomycetaceae bacterium]